MFFSEVIKLFVELAVLWIIFILNIYKAKLVDVLIISKFVSHIENILPTLQSHNSKHILIFSPKLSFVQELQGFNLQEDMGDQ